MKSDTVDIPGAQFPLLNEVIHFYQPKHHQLMWHDHLERSCQCAANSIFSATAVTGHMLLYIKASTMSSTQWGV